MLQGLEAGDKAPGEPASREGPRPGSPTAGGARALWVSLTRALIPFRRPHPRDSVPSQKPTPDHHLGKLGKKTGTLADSNTPFKARTKTGGVYQKRKHALL